MNRSFCAILLLMAATLIGCPATIPPAAFPQRGVDCPERPDAMSRIEEIERLGRSAREARANLITQWPEDRAAGRRIVATLHDPHLTLIENILQMPRRARQPDDAWLASYLLRASIELRGTEPIAVLERGDRRALRLLTKDGTRLPILLITRQRDGESWIYRLAYDPPTTKEALMRLELFIPLEPRTGEASFHWALSQRNLERLDRLPVAFGLSWLRDLVWARKAALSGDLVNARRLTRRLGSCEPRTEAAALLSALANERPGPSKTFDFGASDEPGAREAATRPEATKLALRGAVLAHLAPAARRGLIGAASYRALQELLRSAAERPNAKALFAFDQGLTKALKEALSPLAPIAAPAPRLVALKPTSAPEEGQVRRELALRLAFAARGLEPGMVGAPRAPLDAPRLAVLAGEGKEQQTFLEQLHRRVGASWLYLGLPRARYAKPKLISPPASYWARRARAAKGRADLEALAKKVLESALVGADDALAQEAMRATSAARSESLLQLAKGDPPRLVAFLRGLSTKDLNKRRALLHPYTRHGSREVRAAAIAALGRAGELNAARVALRDSAPEVAVAAVVALLKHGDGAALKSLAQVLARPGEKRRRMLVALERAPSGTLGTKSQRNTLERGLSRLFRKSPEARAPLLRIAAKLQLARLLSLGLEGQALALRRLAAAGLASTPSTPIKTLHGLSNDADAEIKLWAKIGLARLKDAGALLSLGTKARQGCVIPARVIPVLAPSMDKQSRRRLFAEALRGPCPELAERIWPLIAKFFTGDIELQRAGLGHQRAKVRVLAAISTLGH